LNGVTVIQRHPEEANFVWGIGYRFGGGKTIEPECAPPSLSSPPPASEQKQDRQLFSLLVPPASTEAEKPLFVTVNFSGGKSHLTRRQRRLLDGLVAYIKGEQQAVVVISTTSNSLGQERAEEIRHYLVKEKGVSDDRVKINPATLPSANGSWRLMWWVRREVERP